MSDCRFGVSPVNYPDPDPEGQRTDDGACLYYKLTNKPKGSGDLKIMNPIVLDQGQ